MSNDEILQKQEDPWDYGQMKIPAELKPVVLKAMDEARKIGVHFWDNYGTMCAYNGKVIRQPVPDKSLGTKLNDRNVYGLNVSNFGAGNADDDLYVSFK